jgi:hypothetical protein
MGLRASLHQRQGVRSEAIAGHQAQKWAKAGKNISQSPSEPEGVHVTDSLLEFTDASDLFPIHTFAP